MVGECFNGEDFHWRHGRYTKYILMNKYSRSYRTSELSHVLFESRLRRLLRWCQSCQLESLAFPFARKYRTRIGRNSSYWRTASQRHAAGLLLVWFSPPITGFFEGHFALPRLPTTPLRLTGLHLRANIFVICRNLMPGILNMAVVNISSTSAESTAKIDLQIPTMSHFPREAILRLDIVN